MLYYPRIDEIRPIVQAGIDKHPRLKSRWLKAEQILLNGSLFWRRSWRCESQSHPLESYACDFTGCTCPDFIAAGCTVAGAIFCKHKLALLALREIAGIQIQARLIGRYKGSADMMRGRSAPNAGVMTADGAKLVTVADYRDRIPTTICGIQWTKRGLRPRTEADLHDFLRWLEKADELPATVEAALMYDRLRARGVAEDEAAAAADEYISAKYAGEL